MIKYIDLFAGIGGVRIGFTNALESAGIQSRCVMSSEIDTKACQTYEMNFGEYPLGDITEITDIPFFDMMLAGFPCQPFSYAGKRKGFGDTRGTLFFEIERILRQYHPKAFLLENVRGLKMHDGGRTFDTIISHLHGLGYGTHVLVLNSSDFGVPQNRVRLYILGLRGATPSMSLVSNLGAADSHKYKEVNLQTELFDSIYPATPRTVKDILENTVDEKYYCSDEFTAQLENVVGKDLSKLHGYRLIDYRGGQSLHSWELGTRGACSIEEISFMNLLIQNRRKHKFGAHQDGKKLTKEQIQSFYDSNNIDDVIGSLINKGYLKEEAGRFNPTAGNMSFEVFKFLDPESVSITLTSSDANRLGVIQNNRPRKITPRECARLQGFPDSFLVNPDDNCAYKQFGNSVAVPVVETIIKDFVTQNAQLLAWPQESQAYGNMSIRNSYNHAVCPQQNF
jgi:DNA (cytosine-5)-methyltransferase 1